MHAALQDLPRTFPGNTWMSTEEGRSALRRVLVAFSVHEPTVGACCKAFVGCWRAEEGERRRGKGGGRWGMGRGGGGQLAHVLLLQGLAMLCSHHLFASPCDSHVASYLKPADAYKSQMSQEGMAMEQAVLAPWNPCMASQSQSSCFSE